MTAVPPYWNDNLYLQNNPDVKKVLQQGDSGPLLTGYDHYVRYGLLEGRKGAWASESSASLACTDPSSVVRLSERMGLPDWVVEELLAQSAFAPSLDAIQDTRFPIYDPFNKDPWGQSLRDLCRNLRHERYDYLFFLPWIKRGGADLASILHITAATQSSNRIAVVLTEPGESDWVHRLPSTVDVLHFGHTLGGLPPEYQALACYHLIVAFAPTKIHIINSAPAWKLLTESPQVLAELSELYVSLYCYDYDSSSGEPVGYARMVRRCASYLKKVFTDNTTFQRHLIEDIGIASEKVPHLLVEIAQRLPSLTFVVYGSAVLEQCGEIVEVLNAAPNIEYRGEFSMISQILSPDYRLFLYTSAWDGVPNVVLEVMRAGMLVVAGDVGGIASDLGPDNCLLVSNHDSPDAYVSAIKTAYAMADEVEATRLRGQALVRSLYTFAGFLEALRSAGYLAPPQLTLPESDEISEIPATVLDGAATGGQIEPPEANVQFAHQTNSRTTAADSNGTGPGPASTRLQSIGTPREQELAT
jgi:glycosyltransferase involved in cell wall biosynthesis